MTSLRFYQEIPHRPLKEGLRYFSFLVLWVALMFTVVLTAHTFTGLRRLEEWTRMHLPDIVIEKGKVFADVSQPWQKEEGDFVVMIDTTGKTKEIPGEYPQGLLVMKDRLLLKRGRAETHLYDLSKVDAFRFDPETVRRWRRVGRWLLPPGLAFFMFIYLWVIKSIKIAFFSLISLLINWVSKKGLSYPSLLLVGIYAMTPTFLLSSLLILLGGWTGFLTLINFSIYAALLVALVLQVQPETKPEADKMPWEGIA